MQLFVVYSHTAKRVPMTLIPMSLDCGRRSDEKPRSILCILSSAAARALGRLRTTKVLISRDIPLEDNVTNCVVARGPGESLDPWSNHVMFGDGEEVEKERVVGAIEIAWV